MGKFVDEHYCSYAHICPKPIYCGLQKPYSVTKRPVRAMLIE